MTSLSSLEIEEKLEIGKLTQVVRKGKDGQVLRVSVYLGKAGEQRPVSEMIHYPDGSTSLHLYNQEGDVKHRFKYDENGRELSYPVPLHA